MEEKANFGGQSTPKLRLVQFYLLLLLLLLQLYEVFLQVGRTTTTLDV
jgi:hypothetical protein